MTVMILYITLCVAVLCFTGVYGLGTICAAVISFLWYRHVAYSKFGGITGDIAGYFVCICEVLCDCRRCIMRFVMVAVRTAGKRDFVRENYGIDEILIADYDSVLTAKAVYDFYIFIKKLMADGKDIIAAIDEILEKNHDITIISAEIGYGVVPMDKGDREWRETVEERAVISRKKRTKSCELYEWGTELNEDNTYTSRYDGGKFKAKIYRNNGRRFNKYRLSER